MSVLKVQNVFYINLTNIDINFKKFYLSYLIMSQQIDFTITL